MSKNEAGQSVYDIAVEVADEMGDNDLKEVWPDLLFQPVLNEAKTPDRVSPCKVIHPGALTGCRRWLLGIGSRGARLPRRPALS